MTSSIRELDRKKDRRAVEGIDTSFETDRVFDLVAAQRSLTLVERTLERPMTKRYPIDEVFAAWASWQRGWVADDEGVRGFATVEYVPWHQRVVLWFLYIERNERRRGLGRQLLAQVEHYARSVGATHVWLETSNVNVPGVRAYERRGYSLCGVDALYYGRYMPGESAIYLAKWLG